MYMYIIFKRGMKIYIKKKKSIYIRQFKNKFCLNKSLCAMIIRILQGISIILIYFLLVMIYEKLIHVFD